MPFDLWIALVGAAGLIATVTWVLARLAFSRFGAGEMRFRSVTAPVQALGIERTALSETPDPLLDKLSTALRRSAGSQHRVRVRLAKAGLDTARAAILYSSAQLLASILAASAVLIVFGTAGWLLALVAALAGYALPIVWLRRMTSKRKKAIENGVPDVLDLFVLCMQAGSSLEQAIVKAGEELVVSHPALSDELQQITTEIRAGRPRSEAFKNFETRTGVDDVRTLVTMLIQTDRFGTSVSQALRTHASASRTQRRQRAEEKAGKVGVKLVFPLVLCSFPAVYIVCLGPVVIQVYRVFF